jgi:hypothetical protein
MLVCASPMIASYFTYYVIKPKRRTNYGALIDQRTHPMPEDGDHHARRPSARRWNSTRASGSW